jgi:type I restriction enzyme, S subunit
MRVMKRSSKGVSTDLPQRSKTAEIRADKASHHQEVVVTQAGWEMMSFGEICDRVQNAASPSPKGERLYLGLEHLASGQPSLVGRGKESDVTSSKSEFRKSDVLFGKLRPYLRKSVLAVEDGICSTDILVFRATAKSCPEYLCFLTHTDEFIEHAKATTSGVQHPRTSWASLRDFKLSVPPLAEQRKIAAVLGLVQRAMEQQGRLLALTAELKKALLHHLFTHGLRHEPQKQTEIGQIPQSWEVAQIDELVSRGVVGKPLDGNHGNIHPKTDDFVREGIPFIMASDLKDGRIDLTGCAHLRKEQADKLQKGFAREGDVLISHKATIGVTAIVPAVEHYVMLTPQVTYYRVLDQRVLSNVYLKAFFDSPLFQTPFRCAATDGSTRDYIGITKQRSLFLVLPRLDEQMEIAAIFSAVDQKTAVHRRKHAALSALFRTLLYELMTARIRVHILDPRELKTAATK